MPKLLKWPLRWMIISFLMALNVGVAFYIALAINPFSAFSVLIMMPVVWLFSFGSLKMRLLNALPLIALSVVLFSGFSYGRWDAALWVFMAVPYIGLVLKPKRHPLKYAMILISTAIILLDVSGVRDITVFTRLGFTLVIYGVFLPPIILSKLKNLMRKVKGLH